MATSFDELVRELRRYREQKETIKAITKGLRQAVVPARRAVRNAAREILPKSGGLNEWVARASMLIQIRLSGRRAGVRLKAGRNSERGRTDMTAIDRGRVRAPSWGRRVKGAWHVVEVTPGFFTETLHDLPDWHDDVDAAVDRSLETLRRG